MAKKTLPKTTGEKPETRSRPVGLALSREEWQTIDQFWNQAGNLLTVAPDSPDDEQFWAFLQLLKNTWKPFGDLIFKINCRNRVPEEWSQEAQANAAD